MRSSHIICGAVISLLAGPSAALAQTSPEVASRLRPLGSPSAVDRYRQQIVPTTPMIPTPGDVGQPARKLQQVAWMQATDSSPMTMPQLPPSLSNGGAMGSSGTPAPGFPLPAAPGVASPGGVAAPSTVSPNGQAPRSGFPVPPTGALPAAPPTTVVTPIPPTAGSSATGALPPSTTIPRATAPAPTTGGALPVNPNVNAAPVPAVPVPAVPGTRVIPNQAPLSTTIPPRVVVSNDYAPIAQPRLDGFATVDNCRNVTGPSSYRAAGFFNCAPASYGVPSYTVPAAYTPPPAQIAPVSTLPPAAVYPATGPVSITGTLPPVLPGSAGYRPLFSLGQENQPVQVGQGLIGQPVAYVPGQTFRNWLRYLAP